MNSSLNLLRFSLVLLILTLLAGLMTALAYFDPALWGSFLPFQKLRSLHTGAAIFWVLSAAQGAVYYLTRIHFGKKAEGSRAGQMARILWVGSVLLALFSLLVGNFGGREYWEYPPWINLPILAGWLCFALYLYPLVFRQGIRQPVYVWMWSTGILFFILSLTEANLWIFPWFRETIVRDLTVQWKANGAIVGAWNQLVYGAAIYLMAKLGGEEKTAHSWKAFFFYFLGMSNLMFNWGHHTYNVPAAPWVRHVAYAVSMTEWVFLLNMLYTFRGKLKLTRQYSGMVAARFLWTAEVWVFLNLLLALAMSVPAINLYTHGTHAVVAHAMGTTIGINTFLLLAALSYIVGTRSPEVLLKREKHLHLWRRMAHYSLLVFWLALIAAGAVKAFRMVVRQESFRTAMEAVYSILQVFTGAGGVLALSLLVLALLLLRSLQKLSVPVPQ